MRNMRRLVIGTVMALTPLLASTATSAASPSDCSSRAAAALKRCAHASSTPAAGNKLRFFTTATPQTDPPLHGTQPHGQGTAAVIDAGPNMSRPLTCNTPPGSDAAGQRCDPELVVVGRSRGIQRADGTYHGHITVAAVGGSEIVGVDTNQGESKTGPLSALQTMALDALCMGTSMNVCLKAVVANSTTTTTGSTNHFEATNVALGGAGTGITASAATSDGNINTSADGKCQTATGASRVTNAMVATTVLANLAESSTVSTACQNAAPTQVNTSRVLSLGGPVPFPAAGCDIGTPNVVTGIPMLLPVVCNADDRQPAQPGDLNANQPQANAPYGVREALDVFIAASGPNAAAKATTGAAESLAVAPPVQTCPAGQTGTPPNCVTPPPKACPAGQTGTPPNCVANPGELCNTNGDNDCVSGNGPFGARIPEGAAEDKARDCAANVKSEGDQNCSPAKKDNTKSGKTRCNSNGDNDCVNGNGPFGPRLPEGGSVDRARDCAEGGANEGGPTSCPSGASAARTRSSLPFTGLDLLPLGIAGLVLLSGGALLLRRRNGSSQTD